MDSNVHIKVATIVIPGSPSDSRLTVRIMPEMEKIEDEFLPRWPAFFREKILTGVTDEQVWVICNTDFTVGYILGPSNYFSWKGSYGTESFSLDLWNTLANIYLESRGQTLFFANLEITFWSDKSIHFVDRASGGSTIILSTGVIHSIKDDEIYMAVGESRLKVNAEEVTLKGKTVRLSGEVRLGDNPTGKVTVTATDGSASPSKYVWA